MPLTLSTGQQQLFDRSQENIEQVEGLFVEAKVLFPDFQPDISGLKQQLANPFSIFICGEFNAGKSSLLNYLGDNTNAPVGIIPTTKTIESYDPEDLGGLVFIDSPGTNSIIEQHQELTENYLKQADIILFVTSIERPLSKSEQDFLFLVDSTWARKVIITINKIDLATEAEVKQVKAYVSDGLEEIFTEMPPVFAISSHTGAGMEELKNFLLAFLAETEKIKLKLQGPQNSLLVYLDRLEKRNQVIQEKLEAEKVIFDRTLQRIKERLEEYKLLFAIFQRNIDDLFRLLIQTTNKIVNEKIAFFSIAKKRLTNEDDKLEEKLITAIKEAQLDQNLQEIFREATITFMQYRDRIFREATEDIETAITLGEDKLIIPTLNSEQVDIQQMSEKIKLAADKGLNNCGKLGIAAAVTGLGGQMLFSAASLDASAFVLSVLFGLFSINALPRERDKVKEQIEITFRELQKTYTDTLWKALATELNGCLQKFIDTITPRQQELETQLNLSKSITEKITASKLQIESILQELEQL
ncbi:Dynamin family protein [Hyella patelloides LEGE 07179]|uniref:Dynamin family protein n=1 Tax=Hyella patelloides LEGE 07179 TaxID=945734 RepID=A0A563VKL6_9CYAN|nr:dynamin family protein [Hyella patelloides]VEP11887.1 Dynamin family protein [Hyella patelloides LEGE 07179]